MAKDTNLSGRWAGHYYQHNGPHPISLDIVQDGERLSGSMWDGDTEKEVSVFEAAAEAGLPPGADEQIVAQLGAMFPETRPIPFAMSLTFLPSRRSRAGSGAIRFIS